MELKGFKMRRGKFEELTTLYKEGSPLAYGEPVFIADLNALAIGLDEKEFVLFYGQKMSIHE